ncbi:hypothetical protein BDQ12DRAFT_733877 [Crucibulum laeve]|uniref:MYND-type domain-containing protein n=1 Tax=Crucibulum laeve TaxID=68775 RepID=A0A5C3M5R9_9AGAR|nr:hypothetical protein BDQ12DRAFT_733877 [Crucibulum laeve]
MAATRTQSIWMKAMGAPDPTVNPDAWNDMWEKRLAVDPMASSEDILIKEHVDQPQVLLSQIRYNTQHLCRHQQFLSLAATEAFQKGFESKWLNSSASVRSKHLLEGFVRSCIMNPDGEGDRLYCSDLTLAAMNKDKGAAFIRLLKKYIHTDSSKIPSTPLSYPSPKWNYKLEAAKANDKNSIATAVWEWVQLGRDLYICRFLVGTIGSFYNEPRPSPPIINSPRASGYGSYNHEVVKDLKKKVGKEAVKVIDREWKDSKKETVKFCERCLKSEGPETELFKQCSRCANEVQRKVFYCSAECQREDWKQHKKICGKELTLETAKSTAVPPSGLPLFPTPPNTDDESKQIGPPTGGFKRSAALTKQIEQLKERKGSDTDYILFSCNGKSHDVQIRKSETTLKMAFQDVRKAAFTKGDPKSVIHLAQYLVHHGAKLAGASLSTSEILDQLSSEFPGVEIRRGIDMLEAFISQDPLKRGKTAVDLDAELKEEQVHATLNDRDGQAKSKEILREQWDADGTTKLFESIVNGQMPVEASKKKIIKDIYDAVIGDGDMAHALKLMENMGL